ncbi:response regulator transcription factor [Cohnella lupini]|uniref:DNA-binding response OmpR family regulator n=1 Tax=Cohnella lupini TaxID=1294267 RepID=A0A3D9HYZ8_9BACL|nr:response regulator transcription factor [Cohnella lupini]RED54727.1 DNA-binding response OmpR family regulator [Cohnella lupini]
MRLLVVEDDPSLLKIIREVFNNEGFLTDGALTGDEGYRWAAQAIHDLIVLDVMLPGMSGIEVVEKLRSKSLKTPVILLTAKDAVDDRVAGLDAGADDYITKPFAVSELLARSRAVLRRRGTIENDGELVCGPIHLIPTRREAYMNDTSLNLTTTEYELLEYFVCNKDQILTREQIFVRVWGFDSNSSTTAVDVYVHHLRKKLGDEGNLLRTVRGIGYLLNGDSDV